MNYLEANIEIDAEFAEIIIAELAEIGFESFLENDNGIQAYVTQENFNDISFKQLMELYATRTSLFYELIQIEKQNWNEEWEKNFQAIEIADKILVRSTFHESQPGFQHEIIITPKMSFGTGHHETTAQVMELQLDIDHQNKKVLDIGTGTGILAILAEKLGAAQVRAFDIDEWSVENTIENIDLNECKKIMVGLGTINDENTETYNIVIANINRNILLAEIPTYTKFMADDSYLLLSGFYEKDIADIESLANTVGLKKTRQISKKDWAAVVFSNM